MLFEIEFQFVDESQNFIHELEATCSTELANIAYLAKKEFGAENVTFGQKIERNSKGEPDYPKEAENEGS